jgi:CheY-like chemotaxis protein
LSVVHGIVRSHDGAINVESRVGHGTSFHLYFPEVDAPNAPAISGVVAHASGSGQHVLYVDDEEALVFLTTRVLERLGYRVTGRSDARQALRDFSADPSQFDAVISDLSMPGMTGPELAKVMLAMRPDLPIVLTSGYIREEDMEQVRALNIRDLVLKPNTVEALGDALHKALAAAKAA